jgi:hypothetical protein
MGGGIFPFWFTPAPRPVVYVLLIFPGTNLGLALVTATYLAKHLWTPSP